jgi:hypothetical protein
VIAWAGTEALGEAIGGVAEFFDVLATATGPVWEMMENAAGETAWATDQGSDTGMHVDRAEG